MRSLVFSTSIMLSEMCLTKVIAVKRSNEITEYYHRLQIHWSVYFFSVYQRVCVWNWTDESESPECQVDLRSKYGCQVCCKITFNMVLGSLSQSIFHYNGVQAFTATSAGNIVLWDKQTESVSHQPVERKAVKLVLFNFHLLLHFAIHLMSIRFIVTGDVNGHIKLYDGNLKLINVYIEFSLDPIRSISFSKEKPSISGLGYPKDCTLDANMVLTILLIFNCLYYHLKAEPLEAVACHPKQPLVAMGSHSGTIKVWDYERKEAICSRVFKPHKQIQCFYLVVGFASGALQIIDACTLQSDGKKCLQYSITHLTFSLDSHYLAAAVSRTVILLRRCKEGTQEIWKYQGRHHPHYKPIQCLLFGVDLDNSQPRLLSLGMDRMLVSPCVPVRSCCLSISDRIEQSAVPTCMVWYPPLTPEHFLLTASNLYKMKLFNATSKMCRFAVFL
uniref:Cilia- and flagella-associated protein 251 n=1 Tax=Sinocyclocheilus grahami TaxID=75366 RepID=A0A672REM1_SINGR